MWKYLPVLNKCIQILATVAAGSVMGYVGIFEKSFIPHAVKYVFYVALPCLVIRGLGIVIDFYSDTFIWEYIFAFLILRAIALVFSIASLCFSKDPGIGDIAVRWLSLTWISTVILGVPIMSAVLDNPKKGVLYGLLAGVSSFIFQLPLQLFFLECHALEEEELPAEENQELDLEADVDSTSSAIMDSGPEKAASFERHLSKQVQVKTGLRLSIWKSFPSKRLSLWKKVWFKVVQNPVLWGIALGFLISLSTFGKRYLDPGDTKGTFVNGLAWIEETLEWFGNTVSPISLFTMGLWMQQQGRQLVAINPMELGLFMFSKLVLVPLLMVGLAKAFNFDNEVGRTAVLIASLPISQASFSLGSQYNTGEAIFSANVAMGTFLMTPTVIVWNIVMDAVDLFPV